MMRYFFLCCFILGTFITATAQNYFISQSINQHDPKDIPNYIPWNQDEVPLKRVRLVFHIFAKDDGSGNLTLSPKHRDYLNLIMNHAEARYREPEAYHNKELDTTYPHLITDTRIRFVVDTIIIHKNTDAWDFRKYTVQTRNNNKDTFFNEWAAHSRCDTLYDKFVKHNNELKDYQRDSAIQVFVIDNGNYYNLGMASDLYAKKWVYILGAFHLYQKDTIKPNHWDMGNLLAHELGHALGLTHPYDYSGFCQDMPRTKKGNTNDIMDSWPGGGAGLTPCQIGLMHWSLSGKMGDLKDVLIPDWHTYHPYELKKVKGDDTVYWKADQFILGDIRIYKNVVLVIDAEITMPPMGTISLDEGAAIVIREGAIKSDEGYEWDGFKLKKPKKFLWFNTAPAPKIYIKEASSVQGAAKPYKYHIIN